MAALRVVPCDRFSLPRCQPKNLLCRVAEGHSVPYLAQPSLSSVEANYRRRTMDEIPVPAQSVARLAEAIFEDRDKAITWLARPNEALGGQPPYMLCGTETGAKQVKRILHALDWGGVV
ncbi:DUF2384 domain-containing protein [Billgrantia diversa]|uniref:MbcA/ParS/Xre antitoxin family protein n=1 Tax=Halomonas sp. MCCC 1A13316 TaxID=2733487 RepID=UPI0018A5ED32|nr:DUF2384 domain-containing protein [Halomonas sp. MCCC 1A13316]